GALAPEDGPVGLATAFAPRGPSGARNIARAGQAADRTGSIPPAGVGVGRRSASLGPAGAPAMLSIEDAHPPRTAFYDISARAVYLPSGEKLEAHSGLGPLMDQPHGMRIKMRGVTPPNVYRLRLRERLFHGVQAIRMLPEDEGTMFRRNGILAHSYMLGPSGQSNGCVSFKDYPRFLNAFLRGEVERLVVVAKLDRPPRFYNGREPLIARATRPERTAGRRLAYSGGDTPEDRSEAGGFSSWFSRLTSGKATPPDR
ncbi:MAG: DUF2778 domain-containing protein, partial [Bryobacterales bacterium]|nr:DUF2778 domain-containing protein [Bryobacterales bacterium]